MNKEVDLQIKLRPTIPLEFKNNPTNRKLFFSEHKIEKLSINKNRRFSDRKEESLLQKIGQLLAQEKEISECTTSVHDSATKIKNLTTSIFQLNSKLHKLNEKTNGFRRKIESLQLICSKLAN